MATQEELTNVIDAAIKNCEEEYPVECNNHRHLCTFTMLGQSPRKAKKSCKCWREQHPIKFPNNWPKPTDINDYCDFCEMMNYVCLDDEGRIIYTRRAHPDKLRFYFNYRSKT